MFYKVLVIGLVIFVQLYIIDYIFDVIPLKDDNNYEFKKTVMYLSEIILMVMVATFVLYMTINELAEREKIFSIILVNVIIILIWGVRNISWARDIFGAIDLDYGTFPVTKQEPQAVNNDPDNVIFSKYII